MAREKKTVSTAAGARLRNEPKRSRRAASARPHARAKDKSLAGKAAPFNGIEQGRRQGRALQSPQALSSSHPLLRDRLTGSTLVSQSSSGNYCSKREDLGVLI